MRGRFREILILSLAAFGVFLPASSLYAEPEEDFASFARRLDSWAEGLKGVVISADKNKAYIDLGKNSGVAEGMTFIILRNGEELLHPVTGESLGRKRLTLGKAAVTKVLDKFSEASFLPAKEGSLSKGDEASLPSPFPVRLIFENLSGEEKAEAEFAVLKSGLFVEDPKSPYFVSCVKNDPSLGEAACSLSFGGKIIISAEVPVSAVVVTTASTKVKKTGNISDDAFDREFVSVAAGMALGREMGGTAAAAEKDRIYIYSLQNGAFKEEAVIGGFSNIINVELADLDGDGTDELFVSNLTDDDKTSSYIYQYYGGDFALIKKDVPFLFRSFYTAGTKTVTCQAFEDGDFRGAVYSYGYFDGEYHEEKYLAKGFGGRLYGFAYVDFTGRGEGGLIYFNDTGGLTVSVPGEKTVTNGYFGETPHRIIYKKNLIKGFEKDKDGNVSNIFVDRVVGLPVYQRIIEAAPGRFFLTGNVPALRQAEGEEVYKSSFSGLYMFLKEEPEAVWKGPVQPPAFIESDIIKEKDSSKIIVLRVRRGSLFFPAKSFLKIVEIEAGRFK